WDGKLPVDPAAIARALGINVVECALDHSWHYKFNDGKPSIQVNTSDPHASKRFTLAHDIGPHLHGNIEAPRDTNEQFSSRSRDPREVAANRFAASLLMPAAVVKHLVFNKGVHSLSELARTFGVSTAAMEFRLKNLGYL